MGADELITLLLTPAVQIALIVGIAEVAKKAGMPTKFIPLLDLFLGIVGGIVSFGIILKYGVLIGAVIGVFLGLSACGLFSGIKNMAERTDNDKRD